MDRLPESIARMLAAPTRARIVTAASSLGGVAIMATIGGATLVAVATIGAALILAVAFRAARLANREPAVARRSIIPTPRPRARRRSRTW